MREMTRRQLKRSDERRKQKQKSTKEATDGMASMLGSLLSESGKGMSDADRRRVEKMLSDDKPKTDRQEMQFKRGGGVKTTSISRGCGAVVRGKKFAGTF